MRTRPAPHPAAPRPGEMGIVVWLPVSHLMSRYRPGSYPEPWSWADEAEDMFTREPEYMDALEAHVTEHGWGVEAFPDESILLGTDGRCWGGHHRIVLAHNLGVSALPVEIVLAPANPPADHR